MFNLILATDNRLGIGKNKGLAWRLKKDMDFFKAITTSTHLLNTEQLFQLQRINQPVALKSMESHSTNSVIMGRTTWESIPEKFRPLPLRNNIVLSRCSLTLNGAEVSDSLENTLAKCALKNSTTFVIGGGTVYREALTLESCQRIYLTQVNADFDCDTFFEKIPEPFTLKGSSPEFSENGITFRFLVYEK